MNKYTLRSLNGETVFLQFSVNAIMAQSDSRNLMPALVPNDPQDPGAGVSPLIVPFAVGKLTIIVDEKPEVGDICYVTNVMGPNKTAVKLYFDPESIVYAQAVSAISMISPGDFNGMPAPGQFR